MCLEFSFSMDSSNIGPKIRELLLEVSEGLRGEVPRRVKRRGEKFAQGFAALSPGVRRDSYLCVGDTVQNDHFLLYTDQQHLAGERKPFKLRDWDFVPGVYNVTTWYSRQGIVDHCQEQGLALPPLDSYNAIQRLRAVHQDKARVASDANAKLEARLNGLRINRFDFEKIKKDTLTRKLDLAYNRLFEQEQIAQEDLDRVRHRAVLVFRGLDEPQIHFYGNTPGNVPSNYAINVTPLTARNLGEELHYAFAEFLKSNPNGANGRDLSPHNVPFVLQGKDGVYSVRLGGTKGPPVFRDLSLDDIKVLTK